MKGKSRTVDKDGKTVFVQVEDEFGNVGEYTVPRYEERGIQPPWHELPIQDKVGGK